MSTVRSFAAPHKGLRRVISRFSSRLGHTDFEDPAQLAALKQLGDEMFTLLTDHANTENEHTLARLEERANGASRHDKEDHERLEAIQDDLQQRLSAFKGTETADDIHAFYLDFSRFHSQYLEHIFEEETVTELLLQQYFTDEELVGHRMAIMQKIPFPVLLLWLKYIIPAQHDSENFGMLAGLKANAPAATFAQVLAVIRPEMDPLRYRKLTEKLEAA
jgi:hypothetical protein